jgi:radical SAM modification target selenobiotic family peptide
MFKEVNMDKDQLKKFLAGLCMASLISGSALMVSGCGTKASA